MICSRERVSKTNKQNLDLCLAHVCSKRYASYINKAENYDGGCRVFSLSLTSATLQYQIQE
jgi:hypothetical protein